MSNALRMPFAEWLHRMAAAKVPYQARTLAIYAAVFDVTGNEELSMLTGMYDRTFDKWKKMLADDGWVIVTQREGGRGRGIQVHPAIAETPVTFTDVSPRNPRKFYPRNSCENPAIVAPLSAGTPAEITPVSTETPAEVTGVIAPSRAHAESNNINTYQGDRLNITTTVEQVERGLQGENHNPERAAPRPKATAEQFDRFWKAYPLRKGKPKARDRFKALSPDAAERAIAAAAAYAAECAAEGREDRHIKWPQGWLAERRYEDDFVDPHEALRGPNGERWGWWRGKEETLRDLPVERWRAAIEALQPNGTWPWWKLTAPPGHPECLMPAELVAERNYVEIYKGSIKHG